MSNFPIFVWRVRKGNNHLLYPPLFTVNTIWNNILKSVWKPIITLCKHRNVHIPSYLGLLMLLFRSGFLPLLAYFIFKHIPKSRMWLLFCISFHYLFSCFYLPTSSCYDSTYSLTYLVSYVSTPIQTSKCIEASITWETLKPTPACCTWQPGLWSMLLLNNLGRFLETLTGPPYLGFTSLFALISHEPIIIEQGMTSHSPFSWYS